MPRKLQSSKLMRSQKHSKHSFRIFHQNDISFQKNILPRDPGMSKRVLNDCLHVFLKNILSR